MVRYMIGLGVALLLLQGCGGALISNRQERSIGKGVHEEIKTQYALVSPKDPVAKWAREFIKPFVAASNSYRNPKEFGGYKIAVIADDELINAFAAPGGYTYLTTGLLLNAKNCAEVAGVMGHELAHITQRHGAKALEGSMAAQQLIALFLEDGLAADSASFIWGFLQATSFSREDETEADDVGLRIAYHAGYNPYGLADFFGTLLKEGSGQVPEFLSSHPASGKRLRRVRSRIKSLFGKKAKSKSSKCRTRMSLAQLKSRIKSGKMKVLPKTNASSQKAKRAAKATQAGRKQAEATKAGWKKGTKATKSGWKKGSKATKSGWKKGSKATKSGWKKGTE